MKSISTLYSIPFFAISFLFIFTTTNSHAQSIQTGFVLEGRGVSVDRTADKPQSKCWYHNGSWWSALSALNEFSLFRFDSENWTKETVLYETRLGYRADCFADGNDVYILAFISNRSLLFKLTYNGESYEYAEGWDSPAEPPVTGETATIVKDSVGILWIASDQVQRVVLHRSEDDGKTWIDPVVVADGIDSDDITVLTRLNENQIAVMWSNQKSQEFGLAIHNDNDTPDTWTNESLKREGPIADDHINVAVTSDGTLYAAVKTEYDTEGFVQLGVFRRTPNGEWSDIAPITILSATETGTRPIVVLNEERNEIYAFYTNWAVSPNSIACKTAKMDTMEFSKNPNTVLDSPQTLNNVTSTKQNVDSSTGLMILASPSNGLSIDYAYIQNFTTLSITSSSKIWQTLQ